MVNPLGKMLVDRLVGKAANAAGRSDSAKLEGDSASADEMLAAVPKSHDAAVLEYLQGVNSPLAGMVSNLVTGDASGAKGLMGALSAMLGPTTMVGMTGDGGTFTFGAQPQRRPAAPPASEADVAAAEAKLGFGLPAALRQFYLEVADGGVGPGNGMYSLAELVSKHREMTHEPAGPQGQDWPPHLLPIEGHRWDVTCIDRATGKLVFWDLQDLDDEDEDPGNVAWDASFTPVANSLEEWLGQWSAAPEAG